MYLVLLENPPFFSSLELGSFAMLAPVDGIAHGGHFSRIQCGIVIWRVDLDVVVVLAMVVVLVVVMGIVKRKADEKFSACQLFSVRISISTVQPSSHTLTYTTYTLWHWRIVYCAGLVFHLFSRLLG